jgi:septum site-determining protein MinC
MTVNRVEGGIFTVMVIGIRDPHDPALAATIGEQVKRSPDFFADAPVVLDLKGCLGCTADEDFAALGAALRAHRLIPVGVQNASALQQRAALAAGLAPFPASGGAGRRSPARTEPKANATQNRTRLITQPVRSGTQIYAKDCDLVVVAPVSAGAELVADGHVHVYGTLRGRAIAGARGDTQARIFVQRLEAELLAIAGRYLVSEAIPPEHLKQPAQVALVEDRLQILPGFDFVPGHERG